MKRRRYLAALAATMGLAGCSAGESQPSPTASPTPTAEAGPSDTPTETETSTETATATRSPTATETETVTTPTEAEANIASARGHLREAVSVYEGFAPPNRGGIIAVTAATAEFSSSAVYQSTNEAIRNLNDAERADRDGVHTDEIETLRSVHSFIVQAARTQGRLTEAYGGLTEARNAIERRDYGDVPRPMDSVGDAQSDASGSFDELLERSDAEAMEAVGFISGEVYEQMVAQIRDEIDAFGVLVSAVPKLAAALDNLEQAIEEYEDNDDDYGWLSGGFEDAVGELENVPRPQSIEGHIDLFTCLAESRSVAAEHLKDAIAAKSDGNDSTAARHKEDADEALQTEC